MKLACHSSSPRHVAPFLFAAALALAAAPASAVTPAPGALRWDEAFSAPGGQAQPTALATDLQGDLLIAGNFTDFIDFGSGPLVSAATGYAPGDIFVTKLTAAGAAVWSKRFGDAGDTHYPMATATDLEGNVYVAGYFTGSLDFGGGPLVATVDVPALPAGYGPDSDAFLVKLDRNGKHLWSKRLGGQGMQRANALAVDLFGNVTVGGAFTGSVDFGGGPRACAGDCSFVDGTSNGFVATYDPSGHHLSDTTIESDASGTNGVSALAVDLFGTVTVAGNFVGTADLGDGPLAGSATAPSVFVARLDPAGGARWSRAYGAGVFDGAAGLAAHPLGGVVVYGTFSDTIDFGGGPLTATDTFFGSGPSYFLARLDPEGDHVWSQSFGTTGIVAGGNVAVDLAGNVAITGGYSGSIDFGSGPAAGGAFFPAAFVAAFDRHGAPLWSHTASTDGDFYSANFGTAVAFDLAGNLALAGGVSGTVDFGGGALSTGSDFGTTGVFVARFRP